MGNKLQVKRAVCVSTVTVCALLASAIAMAAATVNVDCSSAKGKIKTIGAGLALLSTTGPNTLLVSGTCNENVTIAGYSYLTVQGNPTATIDGSANPDTRTLAIGRSQYVTVNDITITGGSGVLCNEHSTCSFNRGAIQNSTDAGIIYFNATAGYINRMTIQGSASDGVIVQYGATLSVLGSNFDANGDANCGVDCGGIFLGYGSTVRIDRDVDTNSIPTIIENSPYGYGIRAVLNSTLTVRGFTTISGNATDGIQLLNGTVAQLRNASITSNGARGIRIGDLSSAGFGGVPTVTGNLGGSEQVWCDGQFAATRGIGAIATNCPAEPPSVP